MVRLVYRLIMDCAKVCEVANGFETGHSIILTLSFGKCVSAIIFELVRVSI